MRYLSLTVILAALGVVGCVQMQIADLRKRCDFANDPRFEVLRGKFPLSPTEVENPPTLAEISNNDRPTPKERAAIFEYDREGSVCARDALVRSVSHQFRLSACIGFVTCVMVDGHSHDSLSLG